MKGLERATEDRKGLGKSTRSRRDWTQLEYGFKGLERRETTERDRWTRRCKRAEKDSVHGLRVKNLEVNR